MQKKKVYLSLLRIISAFAVVLIHTNAVFCWESDVNNCWDIGNIIDCLCSFAVPVFIMISGATLMDYSERYSTKEYLMKRVSKTLIPYVVWTILGGIYEKVTGHEGIFFVYYFFLNLFGVYLAIPLFSYIRKDMKEKVIFYLVVLSFVLNYFLPCICTLLNINYIYKVPFEVADNYLIYALLGYLISKKDISILGRVTSYILAVVGIFVQYFSAYNWSVVENPFRAYTGVPCLFYAVAMFVLFKQIGHKVKNEKIIRAIEWFGNYTYAVYLLHWYVIDLVIRAIITDYHSVALRVGTPIVSILICIILAWGIRKIPILKRILP